METAKHHEVPNGPVQTPIVGYAGSPERPTGTANPTAPGRSCPLRYRYRPQDIAAATECEAEVLYVIGGLYGNLQALDAIEAMAAAETVPVTLHFNGDFNWFNVADDEFRELNARVLTQGATLGNVEAELSSDDNSVGCGCAYPAGVDDGVVERSNIIHARLKATAAHHPDLLARIAALPMYARYRVAGTVVAVVHGDSESLSGWRFDINGAEDGAALQTALAGCRAGIIASSHTCLPVMRRTEAGVLANNGAAGMANFAGDPRGLITRIAARPGPHQALYSTTAADTVVEALPVAFDQAAWHRNFLADWPPGSPAHVSYWQRIVDGPAHSPDKARPR